LSKILNNKKVRKMNTTKKVKLTQRNEKGFFYNESENILKTATRGSFGYKYVIGTDGANMGIKSQMSRGGRPYTFSHSVAQMESLGYSLITAKQLIDKYGVEKEYSNDSLFI
jgi:hypothetical protein